MRAAGIFVEDVKDRQVEESRSLEQEWSIPNSWQEGETEKKEAIFIIYIVA